MRAAPHATPSLRRGARAAAVALLLGVGVGASGCSGDTTAGDGVTIDTLESGTVVVSNTGPGLWAARAGGAAWELEPVARIGAVEGEDAYVFGRILGTVVGPDERVYVADYQASEIRVFDLDGRHVRTVGGPGQGPGELGSVRWMGFDSRGHLWVPDERNRRYTVFDTAGELSATVPRPARSAGFALVEGDDVLETESIQERRVSGGAVSVRNLGMGVVRYEVGDSLVAVDTLLLPPYEPVGFTQTLTSGGSTERITLRIPFAPQRSTAVGPSGDLWLGDGAAYQVHRLARSGDTIRTLTRDVQASPLSDAQSAIVEEVAATAEQRGMEVDRSILPARHAFFEDIIAGDDGSLWLRRQLTDSVAFDVFDPEGRYLGQLPAPFVRFPEARVAHGHVVGVVADSMGVQYVETYRIVR